MKILIIKSVVFLLLFFISDFALGMIMERFHLRTRNINLYNANHGFVGNVDEDVLFFGGSEVSHSFVSNLVADSTGLSAFNLGSDACAIFYQVPLLRTILEKNKPKVVVISAMQINDRALSYLSRMYPYYSSNKYVAEVVDSFYPDEFFKLAFKGYVYNSQIFRVFDSSPNNKVESLNGYAPLNTSQSKRMQKAININDLELGEDYEVSDESVEYFNKFINLALDSGAKVYVVIPPVKEHINPLYHAKIMQIPGIKKVELLDVSGDTSFILQPKYYKDPIHLNDDGARIFTQRFIEILRKDGLAK